MEICRGESEGISSPRQGCGGGAPTMPMHTSDGQRLDAELTFYQYICGADGKLPALYDYTNYSVDENGNLSAGVSS